MLILLQLLTIAALVAGTFLLFKALGPQPGNLLYTKDERHKWQEAVGASLTTWFTRTNIVGTLTSLATVYLFFIGSSKLFGWWVVSCSVSMVIGVKVTNSITDKIWSSDYIQNLIKNSDVTGGVIASIFWRETAPEKQTAKAVKIVSLLSLAAFIWLDFALFADISGSLLGIDALWFRVFLFSISCFFVTFYTLKYGLRGFVFADIFLVPVIIFASLILFAGCIVLYFNNSVSANSPVEFFQPVLSFWQCVAFAIHVLFLNAFLVVVSEGHWLRLWIFDKKERDEQKTSIWGLAILWIFLMVVGFFASDVSGKQFGEAATVGLLSKLTAISWAFPVAFWLGGTAALFSSSDAAIYSFLIVRRFNSSTGKLDQMRMAEIKPMWYALLTTILFGIVYAIVRYFRLPFEKIVFVIIPLATNILPAFIFAIRGCPQKPAFVWVSLLLYVAVSIVGFFKASQNFFWTLSDVLVPLGVIILAWLLTLIPKKIGIEHGESNSNT